VCLNFPAYSPRRLSAGTEGDIIWHLAGFVDESPPRPIPAVISTCPRCHLDRQGEIFSGPDLNGKTRFLAALRNDSGGGKCRPVPYREQRDFSLSLEYDKRLSHTYVEIDIGKGGKGINEMTGGKMQAGS